MDKEQKLSGLMQSITIAGHNLKLSTVVHRLCASGATVESLAKEYSVPADQIQMALLNLSLSLDRPLEFYKYSEREVIAKLGNNENR